MSLKAEATRALDTQLDFINYYKSEEGQYAVVYFVESMVSKNHLPTPPTEVDPTEYVAHTGLRICHEIEQNLGMAPTYMLTDEMFDLNFEAASQLPNIVYHESDLPSEQGFLVLPQPLVTIDVNGRRMSTRSLTWWKSEINIAAREAGGAIVKAPVLMVAMFSNKADWQVDDMMLELRRDEPKVWARWPQWQLCHWTHLFFDQGIGEVADKPGQAVQAVQLDTTDWAEGLANAEKEMFEKADISWDTQTGSFYAFIRSFFLLVKQRIAVVSSQHPDRGGMRRWASAGLPPEHGQIQIVALRKARPRSVNEGDGEGVAWSHQWVVVGHWHPYWVGSGADRHLEDRYVEEYVKGPPDKPLVIKDKVFVWKR